MDTTEGTFGLGEARAGDADEADEAEGRMEEEEVGQLDGESRAGLGEARMELLVTLADGEMEGEADEERDTDGEMEGDGDEEAEAETERDADEEAELETERDANEEAELETERDKDGDPERETDGEMLPVDVTEGISTVTPTAELAPNSHVACADA